jgi:hypothetical protein
VLVLVDVVPVPDIDGGAGNIDLERDFASASDIADNRVPLLSVKSTESLASKTYIADSRGSKLIAAPDRFVIWTVACTKGLADT